MSSSPSSGSTPRWPQLAKVIKGVAEIPLGGTVILAGADAATFELAGADGYPTRPLIESRGLDMGPPGSSQQAIDALESHRRAGATSIVFAWFAYWWLDYYVDFCRYLERHYPLLVCDRVATIYGLDRRLGRPPSESSAAARKALSWLIGNYGLAPRIAEPETARSDGGATDECCVEGHLNGLRADVSNLHALEIRRIGSFSNDLLQLFHARMIARVLGMDTIVMPRASTCLTQSSVLLDGIRVIRPYSQDYRGLARLFSSFWYSRGSLGALFERVSLGDAIRAAQTFIIPAFELSYSDKLAMQAADGGVRTLCAHIRSGDLFMGAAAGDSAGKAPHPYYVQPPLSYYQQCIQHFIASQGPPVIVTLVFQDKCNPVIDALIHWLDNAGISYRLQSGHFIEDFCAMLSADALVSAYGSVVEAVSILSARVRSIYCFSGFGRWGEAAQGHGHYEWLISDRLIYVVKRKHDYIGMGDWRNTESQRTLMLTYETEAEDIEPLAIATDLAARFFY